MNAGFKLHAAGYLNRLLFLLLLLIFLAVPSALRAGEGSPAPEITVTLTPDTLFVGDHIHCTIHVRHPMSEVASLEGIERFMIEPFGMLLRKHSFAEESPGTGVDRFQFELAVFGSGRQTLPPFSVVLRNSKGELSGRVAYAPSASVFVQALTDSSMHDLRPINPPVKPSIPLVLILPFILAVSGAAGVVLLLIFLLKRAVRLSAEKVDSGQVAQRKLRKLNSRLSAGMPPHECYEELSNIMRTFLENHYRIRALEAVTQEIERDLKKLGVAGFESIMNLLKQADLVKFADSRPDVDESRQSLHKAEEVIRSTRLPEG